MRVLVDAPAGPAWNMAVDAALLATATEPVLRFYGWSPHAVSLGYFQHLADFDDVPSTIPIVRRSTGGGAIHHGDELTIALVTAAALLPGSIDTSYQLLHDLIRDALAGRGVRCGRVIDGSAPSARPRSRWCFACPTRNDLVTDRGKLMGSAQRRVSRAGRQHVLHHGSLVLTRPMLTPFVAAVDDQVDVTAAWLAGLRDDIAARMSALLGEPARPDTLQAAERELAERLAHLDPAPPERLRAAPRDRCE